MLHLHRRFSYVNRMCKSINTGGSHKKTACVNGALTQVVFLSEPPVLIDLHRQFLKQTACAILSINTPQPPSSSSGQNCSSQPHSIGAHLGGSVFPKYKGGGFGLYFLEGGG